MIVGATFSFVVSNSEDIQSSSHPGSLPAVDINSGVKLKG